MSSVELVNPNAETMRSGHALMVNVNAAKGLQEVLKSNLGTSQRWFICLKGEKGHHVDFKWGEVGKCPFGSATGDAKGDDSDATFFVFFGRSGRRKREPKSM